MTDEAAEKCSAEVTTYRPFIMGGDVNQTRQCKNDANHMVTQKSDDQTMPLCTHCLGKFWKLNAGDEALYSVARVSDDPTHDEVFAIAHKMFPVEKGE